MHTKDLLHTREFGFSRDGAALSFADVMPDFSIQDRIGILSLRPGGVMEGAPLFLAAIGAFYEELKRTRDSFYEYADVFALHVGSLHGYHGQLDIWPERRDIELPADPNAIVGRISDLGLTRLIIQDTTPGTDVLEKESVTQIARGLRTIVRVGGAATVASFTLTPSAAATDLIERSADSSVAVIGESAAERARREAGSPRLYTPIDLDEALRMICGVGTTPEQFGMTERYLTAHGADQRTIDRHKYDVQEPVGTVVG